MEEAIWQEKATPGQIIALKELLKKEEHPDFVLLNSLELLNRREVGLAITSLKNKSMTEAQKRQQTTYLYGGGAGVPLTLAQKNLILAIFYKLNLSYEDKVEVLKKYTRLGAIDTLSVGSADQLIRYLKAQGSHTEKAVA